MEDLGESQNNKKGEEKEEEDPGKRVGKKTLSEDKVGVKERMRKPIKRRTQKTERVRKRFFHQKGNFQGK